MEERISAAESRGAAPGILFQSFLNALQQKSPRSVHRSFGSSDKSSSESFASSESAANTQTESAGERSDGGVDGGDAWRGLRSTRRKINQTWEQYSPSLRDKVQKYSPSPLRKLKTLFTLSEERASDYAAGGMEADAEADDRSRGGGGGGGGGCDEDETPGAVDPPARKVPSDVSTSMECDSCSLPDTASGRRAWKSDHKPPYIILEEPDANGNRVKDAEGHIRRRKSPLTVQEWVDHLPTKHKDYEKDCEEAPGSKDFDNPEGISHEEKKSLLAQKLSREASVQSSSSLDSILDSRRPDPVEVLLNLGFGGVPGVDMNNCRIPKRFLVPSKCKGGDWNEFLKRELLQAQNFECASLGFRGLSGPSYRRPSAIVANIMEKLRERSTPRHPVKSRFSSVARRVLNEKSVLNKLVATSSQSVLSPDSRKFLESQGKISPEVPRRRIIFGQKSFAFGTDGEFIEVDSSSSSSAATKSRAKKSPASVDSSSADSDVDDGKMNPSALPTPDVMLKLRRSSLQRQKNVEETEAEAAPEGVAVAAVDDDESDKYSRGETKKVPARFVSARLRPLSEGGKSPDEIKQEVEEEIKTLTEKIQNASSSELSSILLQMKELRTRLETSSNARSKNC